MLRAASDPTTTIDPSDGADWFVYQPSADGAAGRPAPPPPPPEATEPTATTEPAVAAEATEATQDTTETTVSAGEVFATEVAPAPVAVAVGGAVIGTVPPTETTDAVATSGGAEIEVTYGIDNRARPQRPSVVRVTVTANELIDGRVDVVTSAPPLTLSQDAQIPAGTTKEFWFVTSTSWDPAMTVNVWDGSERAASKRGAPRMATNDEQFVGVLGRLAGRLELPARADLAGELGRAYVAAVEPEIFDLGVAALRSYDVIVAGRGDLAALDDTARERLLVWLSLGGTLLLDDAGEADDLPAAWRPGDAGYSLAALGEVRVVDLPSNPERWGTAVPPVAPTTGPMGGFEAVTDPSYDLARRAGYQDASTLPFALGLAAYALLIGPGLYFVLRRLGRLTLGWLVVPALGIVVALVITGVVGTSLRRGHDAIAQYVETSPAGSFSLANVLTFSSGGGQATVELPAGTTPDNNMPFWSVDPSRLPELTVRRASDGATQARVNLEAAQASVRTYAGTAPAEALTATAEVRGNKIVGTVTNDTDVTLHDLVVFSSTHQGELDELEPGGSVDFELPMPRGANQNMGNPRGPELWGGGWDNRGNIQTRPGSFAELGIWGQASMQVALFPPGMVRVVGWTDRPTIAAQSGLEAPSVVTAISTVTPVVGRTASPATVRASWVRGLDMMPGDEPVYRYLLNPEVTTTAFELTGLARLASGEFADVDVLVDGEWETLTPTGRTLALPRDALAGGTVMVRVPVDPMMGMPMSPPTLQARGADS